MKTVCLGPEGTFSHELALHLFGGEILLAPTIRHVARIVASEKIRGLIPVENSEAGAVAPALDALRDCPVFITGEASMQVRHHLAGSSSLPDMKVIYAHPQAHEQCSILLEGLGLPVIPVESTAAAAQEAAGDPHAGAITSCRAAEKAGLHLIKEEVQNTRNNMTRFVSIGPAPSQGDDAEKCSIIIDPGDDRPGLLYDLLGVFSAHGVNLTRIESRPARRGMGSYIFFIDAKAGQGCDEALRELHTLAEVKELGCYQKLEVLPWKR